MAFRLSMSMTSLSAVDLVITGIFIAVSGRIDVLPQDLLANLATLGLLNFLGGLVLYRPIAAFVNGSGTAGPAVARLTVLPKLAAGWAALVTLAYCAAAFSLGVFMPAGAHLDNIPLTLQAAAVAWFAIVYVVYYAVYIYFVVSDCAQDLRQELAARGASMPSSDGRILHKLLLAFTAVAVLPNALIILDLTLFRPLRAAQGLAIEQTIMLDLLASLFLVAVTLVFVSRSVLRPIGSLVAAIRAVRAGDLSVRAPVISTDELGVLSQRFNDMVDGLREREFIRETFGRFLPERVAAALLDGNGTLVPRTATATILYADIEGFTRIAESHPPEAVLAMLNAYFTAAIEPIRQAGGVVNQFQGDAMLVTFNVPVPDPEHADHAVTAAQELQRLLASKTFAGIPVRVRIGINTGDVIAGAVGSEDRLSYTVHGDAVNLAARLEALNKETGTDVLISGETAARLRRAYPLAAMGEIVLRGRTKPVSVYRLLPASDGSVTARVGDDGVAAGRPA